MRCPHCNQEIGGITCPGCRETIPEESRYCLYCGRTLKEDSLVEENLVSAEEADEFDLESRVPCSDGRCIGIIIDGKCNICGRRLRGKK